MIDLIDLDDAINPLDVFAAVLAPTPCGEDVETGWTYDGKVFKPVSVETVPLIVIKTSLKQLVDANAETERLNYITPGNGQAMTYQQKVVEAQALKAATNPKASDYPILSSEVGITADTLGEVADIVLAAFAQWQQIGAAIEAIRLGAKRDIDAAEDEAAARAIVDAIVWPSAQVQS
ncbi:hypothetical protein BKD02_11245 [Brucella sp. 09RB8910]|nr:hypothetical protein BKD02_11245 [Brucella sp. 09RB8910]